MTQRSIPTPRSSHVSAVTVFGDFADPLSFLASQRVQQLTSLGLLDATWWAVQTSPRAPYGAPVSPALIERAAQLALPGERVPLTRGVANSEAAAAAYAESVDDGCSDRMRAALFDAIWVDGRRMDDADTVRRLIAQVMILPPAVDIEQRLRANQSLVPLGGQDIIATTRRLGLTISMAGAPLTTRGAERLARGRRLWQDRQGPQDAGAAELPLVVTELGETVRGAVALAWLARSLPGAASEPVTQPAGGSVRLLGRRRVASD